jgi:hypothetical protein
MRNPLTGIEPRLRQSEEEAHEYPTDSISTDTTLVLPDAVLSTMAKIERMPSEDQQWINLKIHYSPHFHSKPLDLMSLPYKDAAGLCDVPKSGASGVRSTMAAFKKKILCRSA